MSADSGPQGPDLEAGVPESDLAEGAMIGGHVGEEAVLLARSGGEVFAIGGACTHYGGPLAEGLLVGDTVRCPWHHAHFCLRTGDALAAPALAPTSCWRVERQQGMLRVIGKTEPAAPPRRPKSDKTPNHVVIIGGGAAGFAAAERLRRDGYGGGLVMVSDDEDAPYDRPNLSKDYMAGSAPEEWIPLRGPEFYADNQIDLRLRAKAVGVDAAQRLVKLGDGSEVGYEKLLIATGAEPVRLTTPGADLPHVRTLRSLADCRAIIKKAESSARAVVLGASFIGLEAAASLRARGLEVHVVAPETRPMERILGPAMGEFIRRLHEEHGVIFHLGQTAQAIEPTRVRLADGSAWIDADLVVVGVGVRPRLALAESAGLAIDRGVVVDARMRASAPDIYAAGDIACWPDAVSGERLRIEHWVVAERQGQTAARDMLGVVEPYVAAPFFWSQHYDVAVDYVGHATSWDEIVQDGDPGARDVALRYLKGGRTLAVATIFRARESLEAELAMEKAAAA
jgi:NADPH-dependent 2,4-dienoyl-CoA reductase/sulfur reductase-like enzyme/nitrite reductase/ring-hydroxylating ferredoxin subunit